MKLSVWRCGWCGAVWHTVPRRHELSWCPGCGETYVDHEDAYIRRSLGVEALTVDTIREYT